MRIATLSLALVVFIAASAAAQSAREAEIKRLVPYSKMAREIPGLTLQDYNDAVRQFAKEDAEDTAPTAPSRARRYSAPIDRAPIYDPPAYVAPSVPRSRTTYDWKSGNTYTTRRRSNGDVNVDGYNPNTGSTWNTTIKPNGSMSGFDSDNNWWTYDSRSGVYMNPGRGVTCIGTGLARTCY